MEGAPISGLDELDKHLDDLVQDPALVLDPKLFDDVELQLTDTNIPPLIPRFLPRLTTILKSYSEDPAIIASLTTKFLGPVPFNEVFLLASPDEIVQALDAPVPGANLLAMSIIHKAAANPDDVARLCTVTHLVEAFIHRWLAAPQVEVGHRASKVLGDLLDIDCDLAPPPPAASHPAGAAHANPVLRKSPGQGALWRLLFRDKHMYTCLLDLCSGRHADTSAPRQLSLAQGRVLRLLPRLAALNFPAISRSDMAAPNPAHRTNGTHGGGGGGADGPAGSAPRPGEGFLQYAALRMVNKSDQLMHRNLADFFETLVSLLRVTEHSASKAQTLRAILSEATADDELLKDALLTLPQRTVEEEADGLRSWLAELLPAQLVLSLR
ncbi:hypothetical protein BT67DRAFT_492582 [Trichocladium antarcticum]|uniref:DNA mismatch repair protein HSM3 N-terminal domain-containing protein n=1 Tax=Trichocladium antarcticum TaxID=1450529 RepID=A0AAN6UBM8_9PEZI|nr:hypothetical protein BT67DRAFT_492582 [Trichocladium antarcticum]